MTKTPRNKKPDKLRNLLEPKQRPLLETLLPPKRRRNLKLS
jgi:hypothetical protein